MTIIQFESDKTGSQEFMKGSDNRGNVSARSDSRGYYNSRDLSESYVLTFDDASASTGDILCYLKNTKTDGQHLVIRSASINSASASSWEFWRLDDTEPGGGAVAATPRQLNTGGVVKAAAATAFTVVNNNSSEMTGEVDLYELDHVAVVASGHEEFRFDDQVRLGQNQAVGVKCKVGTDVTGFGVIFFFFEDAK